VHRIFLCSCWGYCAPEYRFHGKMSAKSDIYSLGVIIMELVTGSKVKPNITNVSDKLPLDMSTSLQYQK